MARHEIETRINEGGTNLGSGGFLHTAKAKPGSGGCHVQASRTFVLSPADLTTGAGERRPNDKRQRLTRANQAPHHPGYASPMRP